MALLHQATLTPTKPALLAAWLPTRPWWPGGEHEQLGAYRLDDPEGEVGLEGFVLRAPDGTVVHVPVSYRGAPLDGADDHLVGTTEHSVLGPRWAYDGCADPVFVAALAACAVTGGREADQEIEVDGVRRPRESSVTVRGSGASGLDVPALDPAAPLTPRDEGPTTVVAAGGVALVVARVAGADLAADATLDGRWPGGTGVLAGVRAG